MDNKPNYQTMAMKPMGFANIAGTVFALIYPVIAEQILTSCSIRAGAALDLGCGPGHLATALAMRSDLIVHAMDISPDMIKICSERVHETGLCGRVIPVHGDVSAIPFSSGSFDLVVSRGSWFFWEDLSQGLSEAYRVLRPGGIAYIGGGFGNSALKREIVAAMNDKEPGFEEGMEDRIRSMPQERVEKSLECAGITNYSIINDESGYWLRMVQT